MTVLVAPLARRGAAATVLLLALPLSACRHEDQREPRAVDTTAPGATLEFGEAATVRRSAGRGPVEITVAAFEKGRPADLARVGLADGRTPYYARVLVTPLTTQSMEFALADYLSAFAGDRALTHLSVFEHFPRCQDVSLTSADPTGAYETCLTWLVEPGGPAPDAVVFDNGDDYDGTEGTEVTWE